MTMDEMPDKFRPMQIGKRIHSQGHLSGSCCRGVKNNTMYKVT